MPLVNRLLITCGSNIPRKTTVTIIFFTRMLCSQDQPCENTSLTDGLGAAARG